MSGRIYRFSARIYAVRSDNCNIQLDIFSARIFFETVKICALRPNEFNKILLPRNCHDISIFKIVFITVKICVLRPYEYNKIFFPRNSYVIGIFVSKNVPSDIFPIGQSRNIIRMDLIYIIDRSFSWNTHNLYIRMNSIYSTLRKSNNYVVIF